MSLVENEHPALSLTYHTLDKTIDKQSKIGDGYSKRRRQEIMSTTRKLINHG